MFKLDMRILIEFDLILIRKKIYFAGNLILYDLGTATSSILAKSTLDPSESDLIPTQTYQYML